MATAPTAALTAAAAVAHRSTARRAAVQQRRRTEYRPSCAPNSTAGVNQKFPSSLTEFSSR